VKYSDDDDYQTLHSTSGLSTPTDMRNLMPTFFPTLPAKNKRQSLRLVNNPFHEVAETRHKTLRKESILTDTQGCVNGYVKFKVLQSGQPIRRTSSFPDYRTASSELFAQAMRTKASSPVVPSSSKDMSLHEARHTRPSFIPSNFGRYQNFDETDKKLFKFCALPMHA
jgi:hypothetical protein